MNEIYLAEYWFSRDGDSSDGRIKHSFRLFYAVSKDEAEEKFKKWWKFDQPTYLQWEEFYIHSIII